MIRASIFALVLLAACAPKGPTGSVSIQTVTVEDAGAQLNIDLRYEAKGARKVNIVMRMTNGGIEESEALVADVVLKGGFDVEAGSLSWRGFIPPRQPQLFTAELVMTEGFDEAAAEVSLRRSADSHVLLNEELSFVVSADGKVRAAP